MKKTRLLTWGGVAALVAALTISLLPRLGGASTAEAATILLAASPRYAGFSPDGDGSRDAVRVSYRLSAPSRIWVQIRRKGAVVKTIASGSRIGPGRHSFRWDGRSDTGAKAPEGSYQWVIRAASGKTRDRKWGTLKLTRKVPPASEPAPAADRWVGAYTTGAPSSIGPVETLEGKIGQKLTVINYYQAATYGFTSVQAGNAADHGSTPMVTLEFWNPGAGVNQPAFRLDTIANGSWDGYLRTFARSTKAFGRTIYLRPFHEMNGNWYPWAGTVNGNEPSDFIPAWQRMRNIFTEEGATNVKFVWCPNNDSVPNTSANEIRDYWPGDAYVDYIAIDGYNFGTSQSWSSWRSVDSVFGSAYASVSALSSTKPIFIAETGCSPVGGDKAAWITELFGAIPTRYPRIVGVTWFNTDNETDWRIDSSSASLAAFKAGAAGF